MLRFSDEELPHGQHPERSGPRRSRIAAARIRAISADLERYRNDLRQRLREPAAESLLSFQPERTVLDYLDRYGDGLRGHPVVEDGAGRVQAVAERTNNVIEQWFARSKQGLRRRLGRTHLGRDMEDQPAQVALTANLHHPDYVRIACGTLQQLPQAFAQLDRKQVTGRPRLQRTHRNSELRRRNRAWTAARQ